VAVLPRVEALDGFEEDIFQLPVSGQSSIAITGKADIAVARGRGLLGAG
jgi:hypothetical protein